MALTSRKSRRLPRRWLLRLKTLGRLHLRRRAGPRRILDQQSPLRLEPRILVPTRNCPPSRLPRQLKRKSKLGQTIRQRPLSRRWAEERVCIVARRTRKHHGIPGTLPSSSQGSPSRRPKSQKFTPWDPKSSSRRLRMLRPLLPRKKHLLPKSLPLQRKAQHLSRRRQVGVALLLSSEILSESMRTLRRERLVLR